MGKKLAGCGEDSNESQRSTKQWKFLDKLRNYNLLRKDYGT
jgi:hypothetical protein